MSGTATYNVTKEPKAQANRVNRRRSVYRVVRLEHDRWNQVHRAVIFPLPNLRYRALALARLSCLHDRFLLFWPPLSSEDTASSKGSILVFESLSMF